MRTGPDIFSSFRIPEAGAEADELRWRDQQLSADCEVRGLLQLWAQAVQAADSHQEQEQSELRWDLQGGWRGHGETHEQETPEDEGSEQENFQV